MRTFNLFEFYTRGAKDAFLQKQLFYHFKELRYYDRFYEAYKKDNFKSFMEEEDWGLTSEQLFDILCEAREGCQAINGLMASYGFAPLFPDLEDIDALMQRKIQLSLFLSEEECCKLLGCESYEAFSPPTLDKA